MAMADQLAERSLCVSRGVGVIIVDRNNRITGEGYNGPSALAEETRPCSEWCPRQVTGERPEDYSNDLMVHAEANGLLMSDRSRHAGGCMYSTSAPCWNCALLIGNSGLARVVTRRGQTDRERLQAEKSEAYLTGLGIVVVFHESVTPERTWMT